MLWTCATCTFEEEKRDDNATKCSVCFSLRTEAAAKNDTRKRAPVAKSTVQATLFGAVATKNPQGDKPKAKKRKKDDGSSKQGPLSFVVYGDKNNAANSNVSMQQQGLAGRECAGKDVPISELMKRAKAAMGQVFGVTTLRMLQPKAIGSALRRQSQILVMATGGGKSLCYQLPAVVLGGTTIVVSPLIALMQDQARGLTEKGVEAAVISSTNTTKQNDEIMERLLGRALRPAPKSKSASQQPKQSLKHITIVFVTPEQVQTNRFRDVLSELRAKNRLALFAIDEAHCISSWGHDFRKAYMRLNYLRDTYPDVPLIACTATATPRVIHDIKTILRLESSPCHMGSFDRPNIFYKVRYKATLDAKSRTDGAKGDMVRFIQQQHKRCAEKQAKCSGIIYVHKREDTTMIASLIRRETGIVAEAYHGGLKKAERMRVQQSWTTGEAKIAVATVAFGMGIDLPFVRYVIHWSMSKSIEAFYQESGRAGRDQQPAYSLLYFDQAEPSKFRWLIELQASKSKEPREPVNELAAVDEMEKYCIEPGCRRYRLLKHFGEKMENSRQICNGTCDYCQNPSKVEKAIEAAQAAASYNSTRFATTGFGMENPENPGDRSPLEKEEDDFASLDGNWDVDGLQITGAVAASAPNDDNDGGLSFGDTPDEKPAANFVKASAILSKYEAKECSAGTGFVNFREKVIAEKEDGGGDNRIRIPQHLVPPAKKLADPLSHTTNNAPEKKSTDYAAEAERLRAELAKTKAESELRQQNLKGGSRRSPPPPPPPTLSFKTKGKR